MLLKSIASVMHLTRYAYQRQQIKQGIFNPCSRVPLEKLTSPELVKYFPEIVGIPKVYYRICKCPPPIPILNQMNSAHAILSLLLNRNFNIISSSAPRSFLWSFSFAPSPQNVLWHYPVIPTCHIPLPHRSSKSSASTVHLFSHPTF